MKRIGNDVTRSGVQSVARLDQVKETSIIDISVREWQLASSALGKIIVLNGPSSSGKTTVATKFEGYHVLSYDQVTTDRLYRYYCTNPKVANIIQNAREFLTADNLLSIMTLQKIKNNSYTEEQLDIIHSLRSGCRAIADEEQNDEDPYDIELHDKVYELSKPFLFRGENVVIDTVCGSNEELDQLAYGFHHYPMKVCLVYNSLEQNLAKCSYRNYDSALNNKSESRFPIYHIIAQYLKFYEFRTFDEVTTSQYKTPVPYSENMKLDHASVGAYKKLVSIAERENDLLVKFMSPILRETREEQIKFQEQCQEATLDIVKSFKEKLPIDASEIILTPKVRFDFVYHPPVDGGKNLPQYNLSSLLESHYDDYPLVENCAIDCVGCALEDFI